MRRYYLLLLALTLALTLASFAVLWIKPSIFHTFIPLLVLYFSVVTGLQHFFSIQSAKKDARTFVKVFLALTVGTLILHLIILTIYMFSHLREALTAKHFLLTFCILYVIYLIFETTALLLTAKNKQQR